MSDPLVSIIVPIYKVEEYLEQCLTSIINQDYQNLEIVLVDDGSPDKCGEICERYKKYDDRIIVFHKSNGGLSDARNYGLNRCKGDYICFVDSDDYIANDFVAFLLSNAVKTKCDIAECGMFKFADNSNCFASNIFSSKKKSKIMSSIEWLTETNLGDFINVVVWNKIYKKTLFDNIRFPTGMRYEDEATTYKLVYAAKNIYRSYSKFYFYRQRNNSIVNRNVCLQDINDKYVAFYDRYLFFKNNNEQMLSYFFLSKLCILMIHLYSDKKNLETGFFSWKKDIKSYFHILLFKNIPFKYKIYILCFIMFPFLYTN